MTGRLDWLAGAAGVAAAAARHEHLRVTFAHSAGALRLVDPRRFGMVVWVGLGVEAVDPSLRRLGPEPLEGPVEGLAQALAQGLRRERRAVKVALMDQALVVGLGNIYACEALWRAQVSPWRVGAQVEGAEAAALAAHARAVLEEAIAGRGTTLRDYRGVDGAQGGFAVALAVYGREGEACVRCGAQVLREAQGGRSTFWCPGCQR
jgi:formamidopyrimidine-DNA glycosylase